MKMFVSVLIFTCAFFLSVRYIESKSVFMPSRDLLADPSAVGLGYEDVFFVSEDRVRLHGWFIKSPGSQTTFLYLHGNAGNVSYRLEKLSMFYPLGINIFIIDYRGYGKSAGRPTEEGVYKDAVAAFDYLVTRPDVDKEKIVIYGDSLGGAVAIDLATRRRPAALIIDSSFSSAADVSRTIYPFIPTFFLKTKLDSVSKVKNIRAPKLFIHSRDDEIIPFGLGEKLFEAAAGPKEFIPISGGHNNNHIDSREHFFGGIETFLKRLNLT